MPAFLHSPDFWRLASIPLVAAIVGWITNGLAIRMTFYPLERRGVGPFSWQGVVPSRAARMARIFVHRTMFRLGTLQEVFAEMDPARIAAHVAEVIDRRVEAWTEEVMFFQIPGLWRRLPAPVKRGLVQRVREQVPHVVSHLMDEVARDVERLVDFEHMLVTRLEGDRELLVRLFREAGRAELRFVVTSGFWFGLLFGLAQLALWRLHPAWWVLPAGGAFVGWVTNWVALNLVFRPLEPIRVGPFRLQGLFLRRQRQVARVWCGLVASEILTVQHLVYAMLFGPRSAHTRELVRTHVQPLVDEVAAAYAPLGGLAVGSATLDGIRTAVADKAVATSTDPFDHWPFNRERASAVERLLRERMESLPPAEFQDLLRPCFQEDEWRLIAIGGVLGGIAGGIQAAVFALTHFAP